jgi:hypothetical protein
MGLGYIFSFYMKDSWTEKYYWFVLMVPAFVDFVRLAIFIVFFRFDGPKFVYFALKKEIKFNEENDDRSLIHSSTTVNGKLNLIFI